MDTEDIFLRFQAIYKERSSRFFNEDWALHLINDSVDDIASETARLNPNFYGTKSCDLGTPSTNGGYVSGQQEYELDSDVRRIIRVRVKDQGGPPYPTLTRIRYDQRDGEFVGPSADWLGGAGGGEPIYYYVRQPQGSTLQYIGFVPVPMRDGSASGVEAVYHARRSDNTDIDSSQQPDLPEEFHQLIPWRMAMNAAAIDESVRFGYYQSGYQGRLARAIAELLDGREDGTETVEVEDE